MSRLLVLVAVTLVPLHAEARAVCGQRGAALRAEIDAASSVFLARIEAPATSFGTLPPGHRGAPGANIAMVVTRVLKGPLHVGDRVRVHWEGWAEPEGGPTVGGCRVPATESSERYPIDVLVVAEGATESLRVRNDSTSQRVGAANESVVRRVARLARR